MAALYQWNFWFYLFPSSLSLLLVHLSLTYYIHPKLPCRNAALELLSMCHSWSWKSPRVLGTFPEPFRSNSQLTSCTQKPDTHSDGFEVKKLTGKPRYCRMCEAYKPPRTHHCRQCERWAVISFVLAESHLAPSCVLRMGMSWTISSVAFSSICDKIITALG